MKKLIAGLLVLVSFSVMAYKVEVVPNSKKFTVDQLQAWGQDDRYGFFEIHLPENSMPTVRDLDFSLSQGKYHSMNVFIEGLTVPAVCGPKGYDTGINSIIVRFAGNEQTRAMCFSKMMDDIVTNKRVIELVYFYTKIVK